MYVTILHHCTVTYTIHNDDIFQGLTYTFVQPKKDKSRNIAFELSRGVGKTNYSTVVPHQTPPAGMTPNIRHVTFNL